MEKFGEFLKTNFEKNDLKVTHHRRAVHDYLGIGLDYYEKGKFKVSMIPYLCSILDRFSDKIGKPCSSPSTYHLFQIIYEKEAKVLSKEKARKFHRVVAQLLFLSYCAQQDIQPDVALLTSRVKKPD